MVARKRRVSDRPAKEIEKPLGRQGPLLAISHGGGTVLTAQHHERDDIAVLPAASDWTNKPHLKETMMTKPRSIVISLAIVPAAMLAGPAAGQTCVLHPDGLIAWWDGDDVSATTAFDIENGHTGTLVGGVTVRHRERSYWHPGRWRDHGARLGRQCIQLRRHRVHPRGESRLPRPGRTPGHDG